MKNILLLDTRVNEYEKIVSAVNTDICATITFDYTDTLDDIKSKILTELANVVEPASTTLGGRSIGLLQHNYNLPVYNIVQNLDHAGSVVTGVSDLDPSLESWSPLKNFIFWCKTNQQVNAQYFDMMACALYSNNDWKYIIDNLSIQTEVIIRASTNDTGSYILGGDWFLESNSGVNLKGLYFTDLIDSYGYLLTLAIGSIESSNGRLYEVLTIPSTLAVWGTLASTNLNTTLSARLVNIKKVFSSRRGGNNSTNSPQFIFALDTSGAIYCVHYLGTDIAVNTNILNNQSISGYYDYASTGPFLSLMRSDGYITAVTDQGGVSIAPYGQSTTFNYVTGAIALYNLSCINADPNRRFAVLDSNSQVKMFFGPRTSAVTSLPTSSSPFATYTNVARFVQGRAGRETLFKRDRSVSTSDGGGISWTNIINVIPAHASYGGIATFGVDLSHNLLYHTVFDNYDYGGLGMINFPAGVRNNIVSVRTGGIRTYGIAMILQFNGNISGVAVNFLASRFSFTSLAYEAIKLFITSSFGQEDTPITAALKHDGTLYIRNLTGDNTETNVHDVATGTSCIAMLLKNGNVTICTSTNVKYTVVNTNDAVAVYVSTENEVNVTLKNGSLVRYSVAAVTYNTSVVTYNGSTSQSNTILNSNVSGAVSTPNIQAATICPVAVGSSITASNLSSFNEMELYDYFISRINRRLYNMNDLRVYYTISAYRTITLINPFLPTGRTYQVIIPDYQSSQNLTSAPYTTTNVTIPSSIITDFIVTLEDGEPFTINGAATTYILHKPYLYTFTTSPYLLTKVTTLTINATTFDIQGEGCFAGTLRQSSTFASSTFVVPSTKTVADTAFAITTAPTSNSNGAITYISNSPSVATITSNGTGNAITIVGGGTVTFTATQAATAEFGGSTKTSNTLTVSLLTSTFSTATFTVDSSKNYGAAAFAITTRPTSDSSGAITYSSNSPTVATITADGSGNAIALVATGTVTFTATQAATSRFAESTKTSNQLTVSLGTPSIITSFTVAETKAYGDASFAIITRPTTNSSGAITYTSSTPAVATIDASGNWINIVGLGDVIFNALQAAVPNQFSSRTLISNTLTVSLGTPTLSSATFTIANTSKAYGDPSFAILTRPISNSSGAITYTSDNTAVATIDTSGDWINILGVGDVTFTASQVAVPNQFTSGSRTSTLTVSKGTPTLAFVSPPSTKFITDASFSVSATSASASNGVVSYSSSDISLATVHPSTGMVTLKGVGTVIITASKASTALYNSSTTTCSIEIQSAGTSLQGDTVTPGTSYASVDLSGASLAGTTVSGVSFSSANLSNVDFSGAVIVGTDFTNANVSGATNLPTFSTVQKIQLLKNINNIGVGQVQVTEPLSGTFINSLVDTPSDTISNATFVVKAPATIDGSGNKVVTVSASDVSGNLSVYIPLNPNERAKINNTVYLFDGTNILDTSGNEVTFFSISGVPFKVYAGSIIAVNIMNAFNKVSISFPDGLNMGLYDLLTELIVLNN